MAKHKLSGILNGNHRRAITSVVSKIGAQSDKEVFKLMPVTNVPADILEHEIIDSFGGMTGERSLDEAGNVISGISTEVEVFKPGQYQESIKFFESDLKRLRKAGTYGEKGITGLSNSEVNITDRAAAKLKLRLENRLQDLAWKAIFDGTYTHKGRVKNFGIPAQNNITTTTDWADEAEADVIGDLLTIINEMDVTRKYKFEEAIINKKTGSKIKKGILMKYGLHNNNIKNAKLNELIAFYAEELPVFKMVNDSYQDEVVSAEGKVTVGDAKFFVPDDKILLLPDFSATEYDKFGELQITENLNDPSATLDKPAQGVYTFLDEKGLDQRKAPHVEIIAGFNGGANLMRPFDRFVIELQ